MPVLMPVRILAHFGGCGGSICAKPRPLLFTITANA
jgi:hypothetical protein